MTPTRTSVVRNTSDGSVHQELASARSRAGRQSEELAITNSQEAVKDSSDEGKSEGDGPQDVGDLGMDTRRHFPDKDSYASEAGQDHEIPKDYETGDVYVSLRATAREGITRVRVPLRLLRAHSPVLAAAFRNGWQETRRRQVDLKGHSLSTLRRAVHYMHFGTLRPFEDAPLSLPDMSQGTDVAAQWDVLEIVSLYHFAHVYGLEALRVVASMAIQLKLHGKDAVAVPIWLLPKILEVLPETDGLVKLLVRWYVDRSSLPSWNDGEGHWSDFPKPALVLFCRALSERGRSGCTPRWCEYHGHNQAGDVLVDSAPCREVYYIIRDRLPASARDKELDYLRP